jgi:ligand-binding SRPBCC domain-containing protein
MRYEHRFRVHAPLEAVAAFHSLSANMANITPPPAMVRIHQAPSVLAEGDEMDFTLWLGPLPLRWLARIEDVTPTGFVDRQVRGPMASWRHRHSYVPVDARTTDVVDQVEVEIRPHPFWGPVGLSLWLSLPFLFAFRTWKTRRMLQAPPPSASTAGSPLMWSTGLALLAGGLLLTGAVYWLRHRRQRFIRIDRPGRA